MNDKEKLERIEQQIRSSPQGIKTASALLWGAALLMFVHRIYYAYSHEIAMWKGLLAGSLLAMISFEAGRLLYQKKPWVYWAVLLVSLAVALFSTMHALAEILLFTYGQSEDYAAFSFTDLYALLSIGIVWSLLRKHSRDYFKAEKEARQAEI